MYNYYYSNFLIYLNVIYSLLKILLIFNNNILLIKELLIILYMNNSNSKKLIKKFYFKTEGEGFKCKFLCSEYNKFVTSDCEGFLYFFDIYLDSLKYKN